MAGLEVSGGRIEECNKCPDAELKKKEVLREIVRFGLKQLGRSLKTS